MKSLVNSKLLTMEENHLLVAERLEPYLLECLDNPIVHVSKNHQIRLQLSPSKFDIRFFIQSLTAAR